MSTERKYADMAADFNRECEAMEWCEGLIDDASVIEREDTRRDQVG